MAKNWTYDKEIVILTRNFENKTLVDGKEVVTTADCLNFDMEKLFEGFIDFDEVQTMAVINGVKQKMDDSIARSKDQKLTEDEKRKVMVQLQSRIWDDRKWNMESKETGTRGPSVSLKTLVPALQAAGLDTSAIAKATGKTEAVIQNFLETGEEE